MKRAGKRKLKSMIMSTITFAVVLQMITFIAIIALTDTPGKLDDSTEKILQNMVVTRSDELESLLLSWADLSGYESDVSGLLDEYVQAAGGASAGRLFQNESIRRAFLSDCFPLVLEALRARNVTDCFIILENGTASHEALFLRDINPDEDSHENTDVTVLAGTSQSMFQAGMTLDSLWSEKLTLTEEGEELYQKSLEAGRAYAGEEARYLGHFSGALRLKNNDVEMITYMMPIKNGWNDCIGVIGIGISVDRLRKCLDSREIGIDSEASYCVGIRGEDGNAQVVVVQGGGFRSVFPSGSCLELPGDSKEGGLWQISEADASVYVSPMRLYDSNTPFESERWFLGGIVRNATLHAYSGSLVTTLVLAFTVSVVFGIWCAFMLTGRMTKPLRVLMKGVESISFGHVQLPRTNLYEFDGLAEVVEKQSEKVIREGLRLADIIHMSNLSMGIIEYDKEADRVFFAGKLAEMFGFPQEMRGENYMGREDAERLIEPVRRRMKKEEEENDIYLLPQADGEEIYVSLMRKDTEKETICIFQNVTDSVNEKKKIRHEMDYDPLTNLYNRSAFRRVVARLMENGQANPGIMAVWDLDNLKYVNDSYGHEMGDQYICLMAEALSQHGGQCFYSSRRSGDEFMAFFWGADEETLRQEVFELHKNFARHKLSVADKGQMILSASGGIAVYGRDGDSYDELARSADFAQYESKRKARGGITEFSWESYNRDNILMKGVGELNRILRVNAVRYAYQPIVSVTDGSVYGYEALIRPESDMITGAAELLRLAESQSKLGQVEKLTWNCTLQDFFEVQKLPEHICLFLNSIPGQCLSQGDFEILEKRYGQKLSRVVVELTENTRVEKEIEDQKSRFCRKNDMKIALDDFGVGYSNSDVMMNRSLDFVKINGGIINGIHTDITAQEYLRGIITYCHSNGLRVVAEGIENDDELKKVIELGVDYVQGLYFGKPEYCPSRTDYAEKLP
ncbi:MAG: EAL domain-containing protein [Lachnospiraceae bacterium]|nr:EAL domain-containing protein [Lachnospiraceae bacterium]